MVKARVIDIAKSKYSSLFQIKKKFNTLMFDNDQEKYYDYVEANDVKMILKDFEEKCGLKEK